MRYKTVFRHVHNTRIGNASLRGLSGGEKKRVSIAENLAVHSALTCWDNSTRGLDSSTALEFVRALKIATELGGLTTIVCLYQASDDVVDLFDKICVVGGGRMWYFGPTEDAAGYFENLGYIRSERLGTGDFLVQGKTLRFFRFDGINADFSHRPNGKEKQLRTKDAG